MSAFASTTGGAAVNPGTGASRQRLSAIQILLVDDLKDAHEVFHNLLASACESAQAAKTEAHTYGLEPPRLSFSTTSAYQGQEALAQVERGLPQGTRYAVAFIDGRMPPGWDGIETALRLWKVDPDIQVVLCTAYEDYSWDQIVQRLGNADNLVVLKKPFAALEALQLANALSRKWVLMQQAKDSMAHLAGAVRERTCELSAANEKLTRAQQALRSQLEREKLICSLSTAFTDRSPSRVDTAIQHALDVLSVFLRADAAAVFLGAPHGSRFECSHSWTAAPGAARALPGALGLAEFTRELRRLEAARIPGAAEEQPAQAEEAELLRFLEVKCAVTVALACGNSLHGLLVLGSAHAARTWADDDLALLKTAGEILANGIAHKRSAERIQRLNRLYSVLSQTNEQIVRTRNPEALCQESCRIAVEEGLFRGAWVGMVDPATNQVRPVAHWGFGDEALDLLHVSASAELPEGQGVTGMAIRRGKHALWHDAEREPQSLPFRRFIAATSFRSAVAFPLQVKNKVIGSFTFYDLAPRFFDDEELQLLEQLAGDISFALEFIEQSEQLKQFFSHLPIACITWDRDCRVTAWNPAAETTFGFNEREVLGKTAQEFLVPEKEFARVGSIGRRLLEGQPDLHTNNENLTRDGRLILCDWTSAPLRNHEGHVVGILSMVQDVTERRTLEDQLRQAQKMEAVGQLAGGIAHDFNNILTVIRGNAEIASVAAGDSAPMAVDCLAQIIDAADRGAKLTRQLLAFSRKQLIQARPLNLADLLGDLSEMLRRLIGEDVHLECDFLAPSPFVNGDPGLLEQVVINLSVNARDAMPNGGRLTITVDTMELNENTLAKPRAGFVVQSSGAKPGRFVCLAVTDTGTGVAPEHLPHIFEPFFTTKEVSKGTGLGLATVYGIIKQHQGWVEVISEVGKGSTFNVFLPAIAAPDGTSEAPPEGALPPRGTERILLVEDDAAVRTMTQRILENAGYQVWTAVSGRKALEVWQDHRDEIDLVLTDIVMPDGISGRDLARGLREQKPDIDVILMSGYSRDLADTHTEFFRSNESSFLQKPWSSRTLLETVRRCLDGT